jgi:hypothetical protein
MDEGTIKIPIPKCRLYWCFGLGRCTILVGSESGQEQSVKLLQNMVYFGQGGGVGEVREKVEGQQFTRRVENTNMTDCISGL